MRPATPEEMKSLHPKSLTAEELAQLKTEWPRCFVCGAFAQGTNREGTMWTCGPHWAVTIDEAFALKGIVRHEEE